MASLFDLEPRHHRHQLEAPEAHRACSGRRQQPVAVGGHLAGDGHDVAYGLSRSGLDTGEEKGRSTVPNRRVWARPKDADSTEPGAASGSHSGTSRALAQAPIAPSAPRSSVSFLWMLGNTLKHSSTHSECSTERLKSVFDASPCVVRRGGGRRRAGRPVPATSIEIFRSCVHASARSQPTAGNCFVLVSLDESPVVRCSRVSPSKSGGRIRSSFAACLQPYRHERLVLAARRESRHCALLVRHEHDAMTPDLRTGMPSSVRAFGHSGIRFSIAAVRLGARPPRRRDRLQSKSNRAAVFRGRAMRRRIRRRQRSAQAACRLRSASRVRSEKQSPRRSIADRGSHCGEGSGRSAARRRDARARTRASPPSSALRPPGG